VQGCFVAGDGDELFHVPLAGRCHHGAVVNWRTGNLSRLAGRDRCRCAGLRIRGLFVLWYSAAHGWGQLMTQVGG